MLAICPTASFWVGLVVILGVQNKLSTDWPNVVQDVLKGTGFVHRDLYFFSGVKMWGLRGGRMLCALRDTVWWLFRAKVLKIIFFSFLSSRKSILLLKLWLGVKKFPREDAGQATKINVKLRKNVTLSPRKSVRRFQRNNAKMLRNVKQNIERIAANQLTVTVKRAKKSRMR